MNIIAVIPARGGSKRLHRKNIYPVHGKPMLAWSIEACLRSKLIDDVFVSTEDEEIASVALKYGAKVINRPEGLSDDKTPKMEAIRHADQWISKELGYTPTALVSVQANSPELKSSDIDKGIHLFNKNKLFEVITVGSDMLQNASFRIIRQSALYNTFLSAHIGVVMNECVDVHLKEDVDAIESRHTSLEKLESFVQGK